MPTPTSEQIDILQRASDFAYRQWQQSDRLEHLIAQHPLDKQISCQQIDAMVYTHTDCSVLQHQGDTPVAPTALPDEVAVMRTLRQLRQALMSRWIWQDALGLISLEQLTSQLSQLADSSLQLAKAYQYSHLYVKYGHPHTQAGERDDLALIAMGKLGANELNLSSDIDLIFVHQGQGETDGQKCIASKRFMILWGQGIIQMIDKVTADGFVFRVDMRLRPWGEGSSLAIHLSALRQYLTKHGREWERFAWLKSRVTNPISFDAQIDEIVRPFVFRHYVDYSAFAALREMKGLIRQQRNQREDDLNIKLGMGGIRDIEFIAQAFQLIYGGRYQELQVRPCLEALRHLYQLDFIDGATQQALTEAYQFLRRLEHALQAIDDQQTQRLPEDKDTQERIAVTLGFADWDDLLATLNHHRQQVQRPFDEMVMLRQSVQYEQKSLEDMQDQIAHQLTAEDQALLEQFWQSSLIKRATKEAIERLKLAYPVLIQAVLKCTNISQTIPRIIKLLESISRRSIYLVMLAENPNATEQLVIMISKSAWIAGEVAQFPVLIDTFLQSDFTKLPDKAALRSILMQQLLRVEPEDEEGVLSTLRLFKKTQVLEVAASDVIADRPLMKVSDSLTDIAEVVVSAAFHHVFSELLKKHGYPKSKSGEPVTMVNNGFAIIGYGKLGGIELSYASDLDLVFIHNLDERTETDGDKPISGMKFATRLAQKLMAMLGTQTRYGRAYEIDMRLRPSGQAGLLVCSESSFRHYQLEKAWIWEHQALVRARAICGDPTITDFFDQTRQEVLTQQRECTSLQEEVVAMREKMRKHLGSKLEGRQAGLFHLKHDAGGIVDIEFIAQFAVLAHAYDHPDIATYSDNVRIFTDLAKAGIIAATTKETLIKAYLDMRNASHQLALTEQSLQVDAEAWQATRDTVTTLWQQLLLDQSDK